MDELNVKIIKILQENGRLSYADIGRRVGLSAPAVAERVQKLEDTGVIKGYTVLLDFGKIGLKLEAVITLEMDFKNYKLFISKLDDFPEIYDCLKVTGSYSIIIKTAVKDNTELEKLIDRIAIYGQPNTSIILDSYIDKPIFEPKLD